MENKSLAVMDHNAVQSIATAVHKSGLFSDIKTPEAAFALMMLCQAEGLHPMQAVRRYHIINGKPAMKADAMLAEFQERGGVVDWKQHDNDACEGVFACAGVKAPVSVRWTMADAQTAGVTSNPTWKKYPRQMLRARVISEGIRMVMPGVVVGLYTPEEVEDFTPPKATEGVPKLPDGGVVTSTAIYTPPAKRGAVTPKASTPVESQSASETQAASAPPAPASESSPAATTEELDADFDPIQLAMDRARGVFGMAPAPTAPDPGRLARLRTLAVGPAPDGLAWAKPHANAWMTKHFGKPLSELNDDEQFCAEMLLKARMASEDVYNTTLEKYQAEGRVK